MGTTGTAASLNRYRVRCEERIGLPATLATAQRQLDAIEALAAKGFKAACRLDHVIEVQYDGVGPWMPAAEWLAPNILDAKLGDQVQTFDCKLTVAQGGWSKEDGDRADAAGEPGSAEWFAALGRREYVTLTSDGQSGGDRNGPAGWCQCGVDPDVEQWVAYERWTAEGRVAHGYLHSECRLLLQSG